MNVGERDYYFMCGVSRHEELGTYSYRFIFIEYPSWGIRGEEDTADYTFFRYPRLQPDTRNLKKKQVFTIYMTALIMEMLMKKARSKSGTSPSCFRKGVIDSN